MIHVVGLRRSMSQQVAPKVVFHWACEDCLACHVAFEDPAFFNQTGREHIQEFGHNIAAKKTVEGKVVGHGVWGPKKS